MKKICIAILFLSFFILFSCKGEDPKAPIPKSRKALSSASVLATYKDGEIGETDFVDWMRANHYPENKIAGILDNKQRRKGHLRRMALDLFTGNEAEAAGYDNSDEFKTSVRYAKKNYLLSYYRKKLREQAKFKEDALRVRMIFLEVLDYRVEDGVKKIKLPPQEVEETYKKKITLAKNLIEKLDDGEDFARLAKEFSDDHSNRLGGDIGFIYYQMKEQAFADAAFSLRVGEYTKEPVRTERGVYIIKVEDQVEVDEKNIEDRIPDLNNARALKNRLSFFTVRRYEIALEKAEDANDFYKKLTEGGAPDTILFKISEKDFSIGDFDAALSEPGNVNNEECDVFRSKLSLNEALLLRDAFRKGIHKEADFKKTWNVMRRISLAKKYKNAVVLSISSIEITDKEIMAERANMKEGKKQEFSRDVIVKILTGRKRFAKKLQYEEEILTKNEFTIM